MIPKNKAGALLSALLLAAILVGCRMSSTPQTVVPPEPVIPTATTVQETPTTEVTKTPEWVPQRIHRIVHDDEIVYSVAFSPEGEKIAGGIYLSAQLYDTNSGDLLNSIPYEHSVDDLSFSPDGSLLAGGQAIGGVLLMDVAGGGAVQKLGGGYDSRLAFAPDGERIASGNREGTAWIWRVSDGELLAELAVDNADILTALDFSPDGQTLAAGHFDCKVNLWRVESGELLFTLERNEYAICSNHAIAFSPDGELLAGSGAAQKFDNIVRLWQTHDGSVLIDLPVDSETRAVAFSPDGQMLAAGSRNAVVLWQLPEFSLHHVITLDTEDGETNWVTDLAFSPDSRSLLIGRWNGLLELWQVVP